MGMGWDTLVLKEHIRQSVFLARIRCFTPGSSHLSALVVARLTRRGKPCDAPRCYTWADWAQWTATARELHLTRARLGYQSFCLVRSVFLVGGYRATAGGQLNLGGAYTSENSHPTSAIFSSLWSNWLSFLPFLCCAACEDGASGPSVSVDSQPRCVCAILPPSSPSAAFPGSSFLARLSPALG